ncbi:MAG: hypothetical protein KatS3mg068_2197 [Candidatus Sericytochromatia bacterium]|nr:MAG: hypothetical protein KatS3mg068_2197 [Candidatus Sericytochromatia bacterium]
MEDGNFNVWLPDSNININKDLNTEDYLKSVLTNVVTTSEENLISIVNNLINIGFTYYAARCLEIYAQNKIGVFCNGDEIINYRYSNFGEFHENIAKLIKAGCLYIKSKRENTARISFNRALTFVEEALRQIESYEEDNFKETLCLALAFELAGHCCLPTGNLNALDYYQAAEEYFNKSIENSPEEFENWKNHKISKVILKTLKEILKIKLSEDTSIIPLLSWDYQIRLKKSKELINYFYMN